MDKRKVIAGLELAYSDSEGEGAPVIMLHGWGCDRSTLASLGAVALAQGRRVISVDFPGFGKSQEPSEVWGVEEYTRQIEELVEGECGGQAPVLVGHSFGGRVGILYASRRPVEKLVLVDAAGVKPRRTLKYYLKVYSFKAQKRLLQLLLGKKRAQVYIDKARASRGSADYAKASPMMRRILSKVVNEDLRPVMPSIKAPTLLIWGDRDTATPPRDARIMERLIPDAGLVMIPGAGHYSFLDNPVTARAALASFLKS